MENVLMFAGTIIAIVISLVEVVKTTLVVKKNMIPLIGLLIGILVGVAGYPFTDLPLDQRVWSGAFAGLAATGLFEMVFTNRPGTTRYTK